MPEACEHALILLEARLPIAHTTLPLSILQRKLEVTKLIDFGGLLLCKKLKLNGTNLDLEGWLLAGHAPSHFLCESNHKR
jgi:hypothetical protein